MTSGWEVMEDVAQSGSVLPRRPYKLVSVLMQSPLNEQGVELEDSS